MHQNDDPDADHGGSGRAAKRDSLLLMTDLRDSGGQHVGSARVRNISATGMMAETDARLRVGDRLSLTLRGAGNLAATVRWVKQGRIGLTFDREIDPQSVRKPVRATEAEAPIFPGRLFQ